MKCRIVSVTLAAALACWLVSFPAQAALDYVNPFIGTGGDGFGVGSGYPGPQTPFGMVKPGPDTSLGDNAPDFHHCSGYWYGDNMIRGFSHNRMHGTGVPDYTNVMVMPALGDPEAMMDEKSYRSRFDKATESAAPGYYEVTLADPQIRVRLTAGDYVAHHLYDFPETDQGLIVIHPSHKGWIGPSGTPVETVFEVDADNRELTGWFHFKGPLSGRGFGIKTYFAIAVRQDFEPLGGWVDGEYSPTLVRARGQKGGAVLGVAPEPGEPVELKVAISYISVDQARKNLEADAPDWDFDALLARTRSRWEPILARIKVEGGTDKQREIFHTAVYHSFLMPTSFTEAGGAYIGFDLEVHQADGFNYYTDFSMWDTFRSLHPLLVLMAPDYQRDMVVSLIRMYEQGGFMPKWPLGVNYTGCMIGTPADIVIADTYLKGIVDFDVETAYKGMLAGAVGPKERAGRGGIEDYIEFGFVPHDRHGDSVSKTLEFAFNDFALAQLAKALGRDRDYEMLIAQSQNYRNVWNPENQFFDARLSHGGFSKPFVDNSWQRQYTEGTAWQWLWFTPHAVEGLIELFGGVEPYYEKLDHFFVMSRRMPRTMFSDIYYWHGNEPDIHAAYLFLWAGRPDRTQEEVRWIMRTKYDNTPSGIDGNDDAGTLSAWFVFSALGFFPIPATNRYYIGSPIFERAEVDLGGGATLTMIANHVSDKNLYVQDVRLNGESLERPYFLHREIAGGAVLEFDMGPEPGAWNPPIPPYPAE